MWLDQLFEMMDGNHDQKVTLHELIIACSPDINNDKKIEGMEFELGRRSAVFWLANIIAASPNALNDGVIDLNELRAIRQCVSVPSETHVADAIKTLAGVFP